MRQELKSINKNPVKYLEDLVDNNRQHNDALRFELLNNLRNVKLLKYKSDPVLREYILKDKGKPRALLIPTLRDRAFQMLLKLVMEPYLEPTGDSQSWGLRPGRSSYMAINALYKLLKYRKNKMIRSEEDGSKGLKLLTKRDVEVQDRSKIKS